MSEVALPKIKVTDAHLADSSAAGTSGVESPSTTTDGGHSTRPRSATSSEGTFDDFYMRDLFPVQCAH